MVDRTLRELGVTLRRVPTFSGAIRLRRRLGADTDWKVEMFGTACHLDEFVWGRVSGSLGSILGLPLTAARSTHCCQSPRPHNVTGDGDSTTLASGLPPVSNSPRPAGLRRPAYRPVSSARSRRTPSLAGPTTGAGCAARCRAGSAPSRTARTGSPSRRRWPGPPRARARRGARGHRRRGRRGRRPPPNGRSTVDATAAPPPLRSPPEAVWRNPGRRHHVQRPVEGERTLDDAVERGHHRDVHSLARPLGHVAEERAGDDDRLRPRRRAVLHQPVYAGAELVVVRRSLAAFEVEGAVEQMGDVRRRPVPVEGDLGRRYRVHQRVSAPMR